MKSRKIILFIFLFTMLIMASGSLYAGDTGKSINFACRNNLKMLNEATKEVLNNEKVIMIPWRSFEDFDKKTHVSKYLKGEIKPPTLDCSYFLVNKAGVGFQWCCSLHGVVNGNKTITFKYHEYELMAKTNSEYEAIADYVKHEKDILHWLDYSRTPMETLKFNFNANPIVTTIICIVVVVVSIVLFKTVY